MRHDSKSDAKTQLLFCARISVLGHIHGLIMLAVFALSFLFASSAVAKATCENLDKNTNWTAGLSSVLADYNAGNYNAALKTSKELADNICGDSPTLLLTQGKIYEAMGDNAKALLYFQKASESANVYSVSLDLAQKIWIARYEAEHPDRTEKAVKESSMKIQALETELSRMKAQNSDLSAFSENSSLELDTQRKNAKTWMWAGIGTGIAGIVLLGTGAGLVAWKLDEPADIKLYSSNLLKPNYKVNEAYTAGYSLIGAGAALLTAGIVLTGFFGYQYTHLKQDNDMTISLSPMGASFSMNF